MSAEAALAEIHQQEGEIVQHVDRGEGIVELDGVEQDRLALDLDDVAQVKIAVAVAHIASARPCLEQRRDRGKRVPARLGEPARLHRREEIAVGGKHRIILGEHAARAAEPLAGA